MALPKDEYLETLHRAYLQTMQNAERSFRINLRINIIIVIMGIVILAFSILYSLFKGLGLESSLFAGVGIADFVAIFGLNPQKKIQEALQSNSKVQIAYDKYLTQREMILDQYKIFKRKIRRDEEMGKAGDFDFERLKDYSLELEKAATKAIEAILK